MGTSEFVRSFYTTTFQATQNPVSEASNWIHGGTTGLDWKDMQMTPALAFGTQTGNSGTFDDSIAHLSGTWKDDQTVTATVKTINQGNAPSDCYCELELWGRCSFTTHSAKGYEVNFRCKADGSQYIGIVVWHGPFGIAGVQYDQIGNNDTGPGLVNGDIIKATFIGNVITAYINGVPVSTRTDTNNEHKHGAPGMGHWMHRNGANTPNLNDYGLTKYTAVAA